MKNTFKGFYTPSKDALKSIWNDDQTLFVFDANVILNLYGYALQTRTDFFSILESIGDRVWMPYHAALEYQRNRLGVIRNEKGIFNDIDKNLKSISNIFSNDFEKLTLERRFPELFSTTKKLETEIKKSISNYKKSVSHWNKRQPDVRSHDEIRDRVNTFFDNKVGERPVNQDWLDSLYKEGAERFDKKIPPGFKDIDKSKKEEKSHFSYEGLSYEKKYGDLILWKQLIEKANGDGVNNVIFISDDIKEDWWYKIRSNGEKNIGPLAELQSEIYLESTIENFHMYDSPTFMSDAESFISIDVEESSIVDAKSSSIHRHIASGFIAKYYRDTYDSLSKLQKLSPEVISSLNTLDSETISALRNGIMHNSSLLSKINREELDGLIGDYNSNNDYKKALLDRYLVSSSEKSLSEEDSSDD